MPAETITPFLVPQASFVCLFVGWLVFTTDCVRLLKHWIAVLLQQFLSGCNQARPCVFGCARTSVHTEHRVTYCPYFTLSFVILVRPPTRVRDTSVSSAQHRAHRCVHRRTHRLLAHRLPAGATMVKIFATGSMQQCLVSHSDKHPQTLMLVR